ncbi:MAG: tRNA preQ1(34) S-adenosylmethionine ribosyltransferase-isomerase QueA [Nitrospirota bacterium]
MKVTDFDYFLPEDLIAKRPLKDRASSRLLVLCKDGTIEHKFFSDLPSYLNKGDLLLLNNTRVFPARLTGFKKNGGKVEILLVKKIGDNVWEVLSKKRFTGTLRVSEELELELYEGKTAHLKYSGDFMDILWKYGKMPLPPYIKRPPDESDKETYQTLFAKKEGSIAAPTASLHFTYDLLKKIALRDVIIRELTLHVGIGTFKPIRTEKVEEHSMDAEYFEIDKKLITEIKKTRESGKRVISVGTTTTRAIEGYMCGQWSANGRNKIQDASLNPHGIKGYTDIFIYPGYEFKAIDSLITNFHLPISTPLMLTSAFCGWEKLMNAYKKAVSRKYRFLSYGDAMLIL